ncbi:hypothetical protein GGS21DRAFT_97104 [Xylaria nigripes]|nr:hypothetical protein GGS21DRAFT_97104 [Xylaria nigripes]
MQPASNGARHQADSASVRSVSTACPLSPASPTLTNPDMILPDYDDGGLVLGNSHSPPMIWKNSQFSDMGLDLSPMAFTAGPITSTTPIIYGNGTMLSDIGEVTEVESTTGPGRSRSGSIRSEFALMTSTALQYEAIKQRIQQARMAHQRNTSVESSSTVTANDQAGLFADFDDTISIDDSNFQGDDEDSVTDSYIEELAAPLPADKSFFNSDDDSYSSPLSRRADLILANAKARLSTMEGNLNRARSSLSPALSSMGSYPSLSPSIGQFITATNYGHDDLSCQNPQNNHNRILSESKILTENKSGIYTPRASSALAATGGYRRSLLQSPSFNHAQKSIMSSQSHHSLYGSASFYTERSLEPLSEDGAPDISGLDAETASVDSRISSKSSFLNKELKRSVSATQVRDLKDQVNGLKGRLSTLCDLARADSVERRCLQSLRTPSPFTHAPIESWYNDTSKREVPSNFEAQMKTDEDVNVLDQAGSPVEGEAHFQTFDGLQATRSIISGGSSIPAASNPVISRRTSPASPPESIMSPAEVDFDSMNISNNFDDLRTEDGYEFAETNDFDESASDSDGSAYHDSVQAQVSHEDREDAFDYEHFFLHSAMGSMTRRRMRRRSSIYSFSSEDSVETTRGPTTSQSTGTGIKSGLHSRRGSVGSISTIDSFATATEGRRTQVGITHSDEFIDDYNDDYTTNDRTLPQRARSHTPHTSRRMVYSPEANSSSLESKRSQSSLLCRPKSSTAAPQKRLSVPSALTDANRSFHSLKQSRGNRGMLTPDGSPDQELKHISDTLMNETASVCERESLFDGEAAAPMQMLQKDDQILVEQLVASLGKCVLGLTEDGHANTELKTYRLRIENARRILEGAE